MITRSISTLPLFLKAHWPYLKFILTLTGWLIVLFMLVSHSWFIEKVLNPFAIVLTYLIGLVIKTLGNPIEMQATIITTPHFSMEIYYKCTGIYQLTGYLAGVLAYPTTFRKKASGMIWGSCLINILNFIRILSIFYIGILATEWVDFFHAVLWEALFIFVTIGLLFFWAKNCPLRRTIKN